MVELQKLGEEAFRVDAQEVIEQFKYATMLPQMSEFINRAHLEKHTLNQIVSLLEKELELNGLEASDDWTINTVRQQASKLNPQKPKPTCHHCKKPLHPLVTFEIIVVTSNERKFKPKTTQIVPATGMTTTVIKLHQHDFQY